jgi:hypothetical protein
MTPRLERLWSFGYLPTTVAWRQNKTHYSEQLHSHNNPLFLENRWKTFVYLLNQFFEKSTDRQTGLETFHTKTECCWHKIIHCKLCQSLWSVIIMTDHSTTTSALKHLKACGKLCLNSIRGFEVGGLWKGHANLIESTTFHRSDLTSMLSGCACLRVEGYIWPSSDPNCDIYLYIYLSYLSIISIYRYDW